jgi:sugar lactone lactonase YvrE
MTFAVISLSPERLPMFFSVASAASLTAARLSNRVVRILRRQNSLQLLFAIPAVLLCCSPSAFAAQPKAATTTSLAVAAGGATVSTVTPKTVVTLTATVQAGGQPVTLGMVNFCDATVAYCTDIHLLGTAAVTSGGTATFKFVPGPGTYSYKAVFAGNGTDSTSSSTAQALTVGPAPKPVYSDTTSISLNGVPGDYSLTATVVGSGGSAIPTGNVSFLDTSFGNTSLATAPLVSSTGGAGWVISQTPSASSSPSSELIADFNGDGIPDLALLWSGGTPTTATVMTLFGKGDGTFTAGPATQTQVMTFYSPAAMIAGDFNGDGKTDLVLLAYDGSTQSSTVTFLLANGDGTFTASTTTQVSGQEPVEGEYFPQSIAAADFNGDGKLDLAIVGAYSNQGVDQGVVTILLGNGDGTFQAAKINTETNSGISLVATGDFNGDGIPDLITVDYLQRGGTTIFLGNGDGTFTATATPPAVPGEPISIVVGDFRGDGKLDFAVGYFSTVSVFLGNGDGTFTQASGSPISSVGKSLVEEDFSHDGKLDLAGVNGFSDEIGLIAGNGDGTFSIAPTISLGSQSGVVPFAIVAADFNEDGVPDLAMLSDYQDAVSIGLTEPTETATATVNGIAPAGAGAHNVEASYAGDSNYSASVSTTVALTAAVAAPIILPASGTIASAQSVTITDTTPGATIFYYASYNEPAGVIFGNGYVPYAGPIPIEGSGTLNVSAYATATGYQESLYSSATYTLNFPSAAATPVFSVAPGEYPSSQTLTITDSTPGATIYYTTNGTYPSTLSSVFSGPITISNSEIVTAIALAPGYSTSSYATGQYYIESSSTRFIYSVAGSFTDGYAGDGGPATFAELVGGGLDGVAVDSSGNVYMTDNQDNVVRKVAASTGIITTIAGTGVAGHTGDNGPAASAELWGPSSLAVDPNGDLFIGETGDKVVRRIDAVTGNITTFAGNPTGTGSFGGPATSFNLYGITGVACDHFGNLFIAEGEDIVEVNAGTGNITEIAGFAAGGFSYGGASFITGGIAVDGAGNTYTSAGYGGSVVWKISPQGAVSIFAGALHEPFGGDGGPATSAILDWPVGLAVDGAGNVYIADDFNQAIREVNTSGIINTIGGILLDSSSNGGDGDPAADVGIYYPQAIAADSAGDVYFGDQVTSRIRKITAPIAPPTSAAAAPVFSLTAGTYSSAQTLTMTDATPGAEIYVTLNGSAPTTSDQGYHGPIDISGSVTVQAVAVAPGYLTSAPVSATYVLSTPPSAVISTVAGNGKGGFSAGGGPAISTSIGTPQAVAYDGSGNLYIADTDNNVVWMVSASTGEISVVAGTGTSGNGTAGGQATETALSRPSGVAIDKSGDIFIADTGNGIIREVAAQTGVITTIAGPGVSSTLGDGGPATSAYLGSPYGIAFDKSGNLYVADGSIRVANADTGLVRMIAANTGIISTVAGGGTAGQLGDGGLATAAYLDFPEDIALDTADDLYILDSGAERIRKVTASTGIIITMAGNGAFGTSGDGGLATAAEISVQQGIAVDGNGNVYFSNFQDTIRKVDSATQTVTTIAGDGYFGYGGDGGAATMAELFNPQGLAFSAAGNLEVADYSNSVIRQITFPGAAAAPVFSPAAGTYHSTQSVTITDSIQGATIYYTTDGSTPSTSSSKYGEPITVSATETLQAIAVATGFTTSPVASALYTITQPVAPVITWPTPAPITYGTALSSAQLDATANVAGAFVYSPAAGTVPVAGTQTLSVTFTPTDNTDYTTATATVTLDVNKATPTVTWLTPAAITYGTALSATQLNAFSTVAGLFVYSPVSGTVLGAGVQTLSATLTPSDTADYTTSNASVKLTINKATPGVTVTPTATSVTTTQSLNVTVTLGATGGGATPSGSIVLSGGGYTSAATTLSGGSASVSIAAGLLTAGTDTLTATYTPDASGSTNYNSSSGSATVAVTTASKATPTVTVTPSAASITTAQSVSLTIVVSGGSGNPTPTGSVVVSGGGYSSPATNLSSGTASITISAGSLIVGSDSLSVAYTPDASSSATYNSATGATTVTVTAPAKLVSSISVTAATTPITNEQTDAVAIAVTGVSGQPAPTGTVTLASGTYSAQQTLASGLASFTIPAGALAGGNSTLTATYGGDANYAASSATTTVTVSPVIAMSPAPAAILPGSSGNTTVTFTAGSNYSGTMNVTCSLTTSPSGAVSPPTCGLSPASVTIAADGTGTTAFTVNTTAASSALLKPANENLWRLGGGTLMAGLLMLWMPSRRRRWLSILILFLGVGLAGTVACGGGGGGSTGGTGTGTAATTAGNYVFTVTGADSANATITASTTVNVTIE